MGKVVTVLEAGLVQAAYSDSKKLQMVVLDYDVFEDLDPNQEE